MNTTNSKLYSICVLTFLLFVTIVPRFLAANADCKQIYGGGESCNATESATTTPSERDFSQKAYVPLEQTPATGTQPLVFLGLSASGLIGIIIIQKLRADLTTTRDN